MLYLAHMICYYFSLSVYLSLLHCLPVGTGPTLGVFFFLVGPYVQPVYRENVVHLPPALKQGSDLRFST